MLKSDWDDFMNPIEDVFFWALVATATMFLEVVVFISRRKRRRIVYALAGVSAIILFEFPRFLIPLLPQPSLGLNDVAEVGGVVFVLGLSTMAASFIQLMRARREGWKLQTKGVYGVVRHPMYLGDVLWALGWSLMFNALYATLLTPLWLFLRYSLAVLEEEKLIEKYGNEYIDYMRRVRWRIIPFVI